MLPATAHELARRHPNIVGIKESSGDGSILEPDQRKSARGFYRLVRRRFFLFAGACARGLWRRQRRGTSGRRATAGDGRRVRRRQRCGGRRDPPRIATAFTAIFATTSPIPVKWAVNGLDSRPVRAGRRWERCPRRSPRMWACSSRPTCVRPQVEMASHRHSRLSGRRPRSRGAVARIAEFASERRGALVVTLGVEMVMPAQRDASFRALLNRADLSVCDTIGILLASRVRGGALRERVTGVELVDALAARSVSDSRTCAFFCSAAPKGRRRARPRRLRCGFPVHGSLEPATAILAQKRESSCARSGDQRERCERLARRAWQSRSKRSGLPALQRRRASAWV